MKLHRLDFGMGMIAAAAAAGFAFIAGADPDLTVLFGSAIAAAGVMLGLWLIRAARGV